MAHLAILRSSRPIVIFELARTLGNGRRLVTLEAVVNGYSAALVLFLELIPLVAAWNLEHELLGDGWHAGRLGPVAVVLLVVLGIH